MEPERYEHLIEEYLDGVLPLDVRGDFEDRLETDESLRAELAEVRRLRELAAGVPPVAIPSELGDRVRERLDAVMPKRRPRILALLARSGVAAAILLPVAFVGALVAGWRPLGQPGEPGAVPAGTEVRETRVALGPVLDDWLVQAGNAEPGDVERLLEEARRLDLLPRVRERLPLSYGAERRYLAAAADVLAQALNGTEPEHLAEEATIVACVRSR